MMSSIACHKAAPCKLTVSLLGGTGMPCELVQHFNPASPLLVGGVLPAEEATGHLQLRLKRHRWFPRILKTRDPLVFSIGADQPTV